MTIGIGAIGGSGNTVVMATDTKGSYQDPRFSDSLSENSMIFSHTISSPLILLALCLYVSQ